MNIELEIERLKAYVEISNIMGLYATYHSASHQPETCNLFAKKTPGGKCIFNGDIYDGYEGVENHYIKYMTGCEKDLGGKIYLHEMVSPIIEVAGDAQTAKAQFSSIGCETLNRGENGEGRVSLWCMTKYRLDFIKEDGRWVIYNLDLHNTFETPFDGPGWGEYPEFRPDPACNPLPECGIPIDGRTKEPYRSLSMKNRECDLHRLIPQPPMPYETWDIFKDPWVVDRVDVKISHRNAPDLSQSE